MKKINGTMISIIMSIAIILLDRFAKILTEQNIQYGTRIELIPGLVGLTHITNTGAAFGFLKGQRLLFIIITVTAVAALIYFMFRMKNAGVLWVFASGFVLGGAIGNLIDRALFGEVVDMIEFLFINFAIINVADIFISIGCGLLVLYFLLDMRKSKEPVAPLEDDTIEDGRND